MREDRYDLQEWAPRYREEHECVTVQSSPTPVYYWEVHPKSLLLDSAIPPGLSVSTKERGHEGRIIDFHCEET